MGGSVWVYVCIVCVRDPWSDYVTSSEMCSLLLLIKPLYCFQF